MYDIPSDVAVKLLGEHVSMLGDERRGVELVLYAFSPYKRCLM